MIKTLKPSRRLMNDEVSGLFLPADNRSNDKQPTRSIRCHLLFLPCCMLLPPVTTRWKASNLAPKANYHSQWVARISICLSGMMQFNNSATLTTWWWDLLLVTEFSSHRPSSWCLPKKVDYAIIKYTAKSYFRLFDLFLASGNIKQPIVTRALVQRYLIASMNQESVENNYGNGSLQLSITLLVKVLTKVTTKKTPCKFPCRRSDW